MCGGGAVIGQCRCLAVFLMRHAGNVLGRICFAVGMGAGSAAVVLLGVSLGVLLLPRAAVYYCLYFIHTA